MKDSFATAVRSVVSTIPKGRVATYGQIARLAGKPGAARAVGSIMRTNTDTIAVPCHRVVGHTGALVGYAYGSGVASKKKRLAAEGVEFRGNRVDLKKSLWQTK